MKYRLRTPHVIDAAVRNPGTVVGDDADCSIKFYGWPTQDMEGLDPASIKAVNEAHQRVHGQDAPWHVDPKKADPRFVPVVEEPALKQDREHAALDEKARAAAEEKSAKLMAEANARVGEMQGTAPTTLPATGGGTFVRPAVESPPEPVPEPPAPAPSKKE